MDKLASVLTDALLTTQTVISCATNTSSVTMQRFQYVASTYEGSLAMLEIQNLKEYKTLTTYQHFQIFIFFKFVMVFETTLPV